jgi:hypothetical protein
LRGHWKTEVKKPGRSEVGIRNGPAPREEWRGEMGPSSTRGRPFCIAAIIYSTGFLFRGQINNNIFITIRYYIILQKERNITK